jgi:uncharacterized protein (TIGR02118 family)
VTVSYFVRYEISPRDPQRFLEHYRNVHVPILARWPGMRRVVLHTGVSTRDSLPTQEGGTFLLAQLEFESQADLDAAFASPQRAEARVDFERFPQYDGRVTHQAMAQDEIYRAPWVDANEEGA